MGRPPQPFLVDFPGSPTTMDPYWNTSGAPAPGGEMDEASRSSTLPPELLFSEKRLVAAISYSILFLVAAFGNLTVFITLFRNRHRKSRVNRFILHLSIADLIVTFVMMPLEIIWHITVAWLAGDVVCRILMFFRAFGFYLSSFILVTISLDRYFAILHPLSLNDADRRGKTMLIFAWSFSFVASIPQSVIFHVDYHPTYTWFAQCVTFNFFPTIKHELAYNLFNLLTVYAIPLLIIVVSYGLIVREMTKKTRESKEGARVPKDLQPCEARLRRSGVGKIQRARIKTLKMTVMIVLVFIMCWTPYFVISAWWWFDKESADKVDQNVQSGLFLFAVSNSCMDPLVYGMFTINFRKEFRRCCCCWSRTTTNDSQQRHHTTPTRTYTFIPSCTFPSRINSIVNGSGSKCSQTASRDMPMALIRELKTATNANYRVSEVI